MPRSAKIAIGVACGLLFVTAAVAPFALLLVPNPVPVRVGDPQQQLPGTYVGTSGGFYHIFQYAEHAETFPPDSLVAEPSARVFVRYKGLSDLSAYGLYPYPRGAEIPTDKHVTVATRVVQLVPKRPLDPGRYYVTIPSEDLFSTNGEFAYFVVPAKATAQGSGGVPVLAK